MPDHLPARVNDETFADIARAGGTTPILPDPAGGTDVENALYRPCAQQQLPPRPHQGRRCDWYEQQVCPIEGGTPRRLWQVAVIADDQPEPHPEGRLDHRKSEVTRLKEITLIRPRQQPGGWHARLAVFAEFLPPRAEDDSAIVVMLAIPFEEGIDENQFGLARDGSYRFNGVSVLQFGQRE